MRCFRVAQEKQMNGQRRHAIVLGASMSGLLAARALSPHFQRVTVLERDTLPTESENRKGVPQGNHAHGLLASGYRIMDAYFPGMMDDLEAGGAPRGDVVGSFLWYQYGAWKLRHEAGLTGIAVSRPALESAVRARVKAIENVTFQEDYDIDRAVYDPAQDRVTGVNVTRRSSGKTEALDADLVIDACGRGSQSSKWLESWGFGAPPTVLLKVDVAYATRVFERKPGDFRDSTGAVIAGTPPVSKRFAAVLAAEGPRWIVTLAGMLGDHPPSDEEGWLEWAKSLPVPDVHDLAVSNPSIGGIQTYRFPANQRRYYEKMKRFPSGYLVVGDAVCSFNPIYGQGMSSAALQAKALDECLAAGDERLAQRFFRRAGKVADMPWAVATGEDLRYPEVEGKRPPMYGLVNRYLDRVHRVAGYDPVVCQSFMNVANLLAPPPSVMKPRVMRRVFFTKPPHTQPAAVAASGETIV
jgi:2-polyprenyl-6-methoxyphenol hydroxylase-like FAD-dependent oxidoreductase